jgi:hypothetical protein
MAPKLSAEMIRARGLVALGQSAAEAARATGLSKSSISQDPVCREHIEAQRCAKMKEVDRLVRAGVTRRGACAYVRVTESGYSKYLKRQGAKNAAKDTQGA